MYDDSFKVTLSDPEFNDKFAERLGEISKQCAMFTMQITIVVKNGELDGVFWTDQQGSHHEVTEGGLARLIYDVLGDQCQMEEQ